MAAVVLTETTIDTFDISGEAKPNFSGLQEIIETPEYFDILLKNT